MQSKISPKVLLGHLVGTKNITESQVRLERGKMFSKSIGCSSWKQEKLRIRQAKIEFQFQKDEIFNYLTLIL